MKEKKKVKNNNNNKKISSLPSGFPTSELVRVCPRRPLSNFDAQTLFLSPFPFPSLHLPLSFSPLSPPSSPYINPLSFSPPSLSLFLFFYIEDQGEREKEEEKGREERMKACLYKGRGRKEGKGRRERKSEHQN